MRGHILSICFLLGENIDLEPNLIVANLSSFRAAQILSASHKTAARFGVAQLAPGERERGNSVTIARGYIATA